MLIVTLVIAAWRYIDRFLVLRGIAAVLVGEALQLPFGHAKRFRSARESGQIRNQEFQGEVVWHAFDPHVQGVSASPFDISGFGETLLPIYGPRRPEPGSRAPIPRRHPAGAGNDAPESRKITPDNSASRSLIVTRPSPLPATLKPELDQAKIYARAEKAFATHRAYRSDFALFRVWCGTKDVAALPAGPETVAAFLAAEANRGVKAST